MGQKGTGGGEGRVGQRYRGGGREGQVGQRVLGRGGEGGAGVEPRGYTEKEERRQGGPEGTGEEGRVGQRSQGRELGWARGRWDLSGLPAGAWPLL